MPDSRRQLARLLAEIGRCATRRGRRASGRFVFEGTRLVERALRAGTTPEAALVSHSYLAAADCDARIAGVLQALEARGSRVLVALDDRLLELTEGRDCGAIVALAALPAPRPLAERLPVGLERAATVLVAVEVEEPGNVGALVRTALAGKADALVAVGISDPYHPKAVRTSMGAIFKVPVVELAGRSEAFAALGSAGLALVGATGAGGASLPRAALPQRLALLLGSEACGLDTAWLERLDGRVSIPMSAEADSYSVNAAAAVLLYEIERRRRSAASSCAPRDAGLA